MSLMKMSCPPMDASPEALLARIGDLENRLNAGMIAAYRGELEQKKNEARESGEQASEQMRDEDEPFEGSAVSCYAEVLGEYARIDPGTAAFLSGSEALLGKDHTLLITVGNDFALRMLEANKAASAVEAILKNNHGVNAQVRIVLKKGGNKGNGIDMMDELS